ncbi:Uncharacterised protein [Mycobacteroides abscessus subsp. abscessus]|nr:Uncharacterised protein [Mycobacteroides abscessus subsp. abscessus]
MVTWPASAGAVGCGWYCPASSAMCDAEVSRSGASGCWSVLPASTRRESTASAPASSSPVCCPGGTGRFRRAIASAASRPSGAAAIPSAAEPSERSGPSSVPAAWAAACSAGVSGVVRAAGSWRSGAATAPTVPRLIRRSSRSTRAPTPRVESSAVGSRIRAHSSSRCS